MNSQDFNTVCRTCTKQDNLIPIFTHDDIKSTLKTLISLELDVDDDLPKHICQVCAIKLVDFKQFYEQALRFDWEFRQLLKESSFKECTNWDSKDKQFIRFNRNNGCTEDRNVEICNDTKTCNDKEGNVQFNNHPTHIKSKPSLNKRAVQSNKKYRKKNFPVSFLCEACGKLLSSQSTLIQHLRVHSGQRPFSCDYCDKKFSRAEHLRQHRRTHTGEKPHGCKLCPKKFAQIGALAAHNRTHSGEKPHVCAICSKAFAQSVSLTYHIRTHTGEAPYKCELCGKCFANSGNLTIHKRFHRNERPFKCESCPKTFVTVSHLKDHVNQHKGIKTHRCGVCQKGFVRSAHLKEHMVTHTGDRPYVCNLCPKRYSQSGHLNRHMKKSHNIKDVYR